MSFCFSETVWSISAGAEAITYGCLVKLSVRVVRFHVTRIVFQKLGEDMDSWLWLSTFCSFNITWEDYKYVYMVWFSKISFPTSVPTQIKPAANYEFMCVFFFEGLLYD